jgi:hypothetical protein
MKLSGLQILVLYLYDENRMDWHPFMFFFLKIYILEHKLFFCVLHAKSKKIIINL